MGEVTTRFFTAMFCIGSTLFCNWFNIYTTWLYYLVLTTICLFEYHYQIDSTRKKITIILSLIIYILFTSYSINLITINYLILSLPIMMSLFSIELFSNSVNPMLSLGTDLIGLVWLVIPMILMVIMSYPITTTGENYHTPQIIYGVMFFVFLSDTGAYFAGRYFAGRYFQKHYLYPSISPKKTWEGTIGGIILSYLSLYPIQIYFTLLDSTTWLHIYIISTACGPIGDLIESMFKRDLKIKDIGTILPGHGGINDRIDSLLYTVPFVYTYLYFYDMI
jgi:phosphatidate cytidylyltransferase